MNRVRLSVIIPHYNSLDSLYKLIESIPRYEEIEILVVDDCSTKDVDKVAQITDLRPEQIELFYNEPGKNSAGRCRNIGLEHARGEWLLFADADDFFMPDFYKKIEEYFDSDYDIVYFAPCSLDLKTGQSASRHEMFANLAKRYLEEADLENTLRLKYYWEGPISKLIRKSLVDQGHITFDPTRVANDAMFSIRTAYAAGKITASMEIIYCITRGEGSLTAVRSRENYYTRLDVFIRKYKFLRENLSRFEWKTLDLLGEHYIKMAKAYHLSKTEIFKIYALFLKNGIRPFISRKSVWRKLMKSWKG